MSLGCPLWPKEHARRVGEHMSSLLGVLPHSSERDSCWDQWSQEQMKEDLANRSIWILDPLLIRHVTLRKWWSHLESQFPCEKNREVTYLLWRVIGSNELIYWDVLPAPDMEWAHSVTILKCLSPAWRKERLVLLCRRREVAELSFLWIQFPLSPQHWRLHPSPPTSSSFSAPPPPLLPPLLLLLLSPSPFPLPLSPTPPFPPSYSL